jgi:SAM-dependent methyltransferase
LKTVPMMGSRIMAERIGTGRPLREAGDLLRPMFSDPEFVRKRLSPHPADPGYLHRVDLLLALKSEASDEPLTLLDCGAGASPYRSLFPSAQYRRADVADIGGLDYLINGDGTVPAESRTFDLVLSTQVLAHVPDANLYLSECFRLLKPGGKLLLSTHGSYEDNDCPHDFRRWTAEGLMQDLQKAGLEIVSIHKLTTGPRAVMYFIERYIDVMPASRGTLPGAVHWAGATVLRRFRRGIHLLTDRYYSGHRMVPADQPRHDLYIGLCVSARRPR